MRADWTAGNARAWGCSVGWLAQISPISPAIPDPAAIVAGGSNAFPESPVGNTLPCSTSLPCYGVWISGNSGFAKADVLGTFSDWVTSKMIPDSSASIALLSTPQNYIARFYSGGSADSQEAGNIKAYTNGATLSAKASDVNAAETALNIAEVVFAMDPDASAVATCAFTTITQSAIETAAGLAASTVSGGVKRIASVGSLILTNTAVSCSVSQAVQSVFKFAAESLLASTGVGAVVVAAVDTAASAANAAEAIQRSWELANEASPIETAVIEILPGSGVPLNPVPRIISLSPSSAPVGGSTLTVTIKGTDFRPDCTVFANDAKRDYTVVDSGTLTFTLSSSDLAQAKNFSVELRNPSPGGGSSTATFTVASGTGSNPQPQVTSLTPSATVAGSTLMALTIRGSNFMANSTVTFGGSPYPIATPSDAGLLTINVNAKDLAKAGTLPVVVTNPGPGGGPSQCATNSNCSFTVLDPTPKQPAVIGVSTTQRIYVAGDPFQLSYGVLADPSSSTPYDLVITVLSLSSGTTYYYYDDKSDATSEWLHTKKEAYQSDAPKSGSSFPVPADPSAFQITDSVPSGDYHVKVYFSQVGAFTPIGTYAETDFSLATDTATGGCFVATAAFGSPMARQVQWLRAFRDRILLPGRAGRALVNWYYAWSPRAAAWLQVHSIARKLTRAILWIPVAFAWSSLRTNVVYASLGFVVLLLSLGWSLRRGPAWWRVLSLLILAIGVASAQIPRCKPSPKPMCPTRISASIQAKPPAPQARKFQRAALAQ